MDQLNLNVVKRLWRQTLVRKKTGCFIWIGGASGRDRGVIQFQNRQYYIGRVSACLWLDLKGPKLSDDSRYVCHSCDSPRCWNPYHLFLGTQKDNMRDASNKHRFGERRGKHNSNWKGGIYLCEHTTRTPSAKGKCIPCYDRDRYQRRPIAEQKIGQH